MDVSVCFILFFSFGTVCRTLISLEMFEKKTLPVISKPSTYFKINLESSFSILFFYFLFS